MNLQEYIDDVKLELTGGILELEMPDETIGRYVKLALREIQRYLNSTQLVTIPCSSCIDLEDANLFPDGVSSVTNIYRPRGYLFNDYKDRVIQKDGEAALNVDPMQFMMWRVFSNNGSMQNVQNYTLNYMSYATLMQMRSTVSTDLIFREGVNAKTHHRELYINFSAQKPSEITIEYVPKVMSVEQIISDYWIDILRRLSVALVKQGLGRIRSKFKQNNPVYQLDGEILLEEGNAELEAIRTKLEANNTLFYPVD